MASAFARDFIFAPVVQTAIMPGWKPSKKDNPQPSPARKPRNNGKENAFPDLKNGRQPAEKFDYEELQANEIIVLESAYFDNFKRLDHEGHSAWKVCV